MRASSGKARARDTAAAIKASQAAAERWPGVSIVCDDDGGRFWFDKAAADRACDFSPTYLTHYRGEHAGRPFVLADWQRELAVRPLFGWRRADGRRRFRKAFIAVPKKNGKTTLCAFVALYLLTSDGEEGAEVVAAAADREQAGLVFDTARVFVEESAELSRRLEVFRRAITYPAKRSTFKVLSADVKSKHGPNISGLIFDELHAQPTRELWETLTKGTASRRQPVTVAITTAGTEPESICAEEWAYATSVMQGTIEDDTVLPVIFAAGPEDPWDDPATWAKANPNLGQTVPLHYLEAEVAAAKAEPRKQAALCRLNLNRWSSATESWIDLDAWNACRQEQLEDKPTGLSVVAGLDLSSKLDLTALVVLVPRRRGGDAQAVEVSADGQRRTLSIDYEIDVHPFFWLPEAILRERVKQDRVPYDVWEQEGILRVTAGEVVDYNRIFAEIVDEIGPRFGLKGGEIGYDPYNATQLALELQGAGYRVVEVPQTKRHMSEPAKLFEALVRSRRIHHDGNPLLRWCVSNATAKEDRAENLMLSKAAKTRRIDGVVAAVIALSRLIHGEAEPESEPSIYRTRGAWTNVSLDREAAEAERTPLRERERWR